MDCCAEYCDAGEKIRVIILPSESDESPDNLPHNEQDIISVPCFCYDITHTDSLPGPAVFIRQFTVHAIPPFVTFGGSGPP